MKFEGMNPTGSFKDRGMTMAISKAVEHGAKAVICASTGNTSASAAAYATHAGITAAVLVPEGKIAMGKLSQAIAHNAQLLQVQGNFDDCLDIARDLADELPGAPGQLGQPRPHRGPEDRGVRGRRGARRRPGLPHRPGRQRGQLHRLPPRLHAKSSQRGETTKLPRMFGFQAAGSAPIVLGHVVKHPETIATAIRIGNPASWELALDARDDSDGYFGAIDDAKILEAHRILSAEVGIFVEPASRDQRRRACSSAPTAGVIPAGATVVLTVTGHGLKDPQWALRTADGSDVTPTVVPVDTTAIADVLGLVADSHGRLRAARRGDRVTSPTSAVAPSSSRSRPRPRTSAPASTRSASRSRSTTSWRCRVRDEPGATVEVIGVGEGEVPDRREPTSSSARSRTPSTRSASSCPASTSSRATASRTAAGSGSSGAAIVSGIMAAKGLLEGVVDLDAQQLLALANDMEGHPDNVAPALFGGLTIAWVTPDGPRFKKLIVHRGVSPLVLVPEHVMSTALARSLQPESVPHEDAVFNVSRSALLVAALIQSPELLHAATEDKLHQSYRASAMPETDRLITLLREQGFAAVVSGAGPSILVLGSDPSQRLAAAEARRGVGADPLAAAHAGGRLQGRDGDTAGCRPARTHRRRDVRSVRAEVVNCTRTREEPASRANPASG